MEERIFRVNPANFAEVTLDVFRYQAQHNPVYAQYIEILKINPHGISRIQDIPFLPISLFKTHRVFTGELPVEAIFTSSGTTGTETSIHHLAKLALYEQSFRQAFQVFYGDPTRYCILALLPSYLEREGSSLVYMTKRLIEECKHPLSGFFLHNHDKLMEIILEQEQLNQPILLIGVTFALLELASNYKLKLNSTIVMETGGMKGRGKELIRSEMHSILKDSFGIGAVHSEYGMTELLSQAYSKGEGIFEAPPWMRVLTRDPYDPFAYLPHGQTGALNIIDLANIYSCSFIQTDDLGTTYSNGSFEVLGRMDGSQIRGCNLLVL